MLKFCKKSIPDVLKYCISDRHERMSTYSGRTRGSAYVIEYNPATRQVRGWNECYDQLGNVNRIHPKDINGQSLTSPHYPLIKQEISP